MIFLCSESFFLPLGAELILQLLRNHFLLYEQNGVGYVDFDAETVWDMINDYRGSYYNRVPYVKIINTYIRLTTVNIVSTGRYDNG